MKFKQVMLAAGLGTLAVSGIAQQDGPYKVLKSARVGGEGGWDYIYADVDGRRLYIPRGAAKAVAATATTPAVPEFPLRLTIYDLDTLQASGEIVGVGGNGTAVDPKSGHGLPATIRRFRCLIPKRRC